MTTQLRLFDRPDPAAAMVARSNGIGNADAHADPRWKAWAAVAVTVCATELDDFTADEVWTWLVEHVPSAHTHQPSALGPVILAAARRGEIIKTGELRPSSLPRRHRDLTVWTRSHTHAAPGD